MRMFYSAKAARQLAHLTPEIQKRIAKKMRFYASQKDPLPFAERLTDFREGEFRFRIGKYRVAFDVQDDTLYILKVGSRDNFYE